MKISLITVSYNSADTIRSTIDSVAAQDFLELEYIIVDGGSSDETLEIVKHYPALVAQCISEPDKGIYDAMNKGVQRATGDVIGILNSDDFYLNDNILNEVADLFFSDPELDVVLGDIDYVQNEDLNRPVRSYRAGNFKPWMFRFGLMPPHPAVFIRKLAYERVGQYKLGYRIAADFDFLTRLLLVDRAKYYIPNKTWVRMRTGGVSTDGIQSVVVISNEMRRSFRENGLYTNSLMLLLRLPFKFFTQILLK
ncbi:MAG: glycosyltransferase [Maribacter sp.]|nr:glycosyltransferase [Maribacter sp.]